MDCVEFIDTVGGTPLLTHSDKIRKLGDILPKHNKSHDLFLPSDSFYGEKVSAEDPERMADEIFKWLGVKHRSVHFSIDVNQEELLKYRYERNISFVSLGWHSLEDPFICAGLVAHGIIHHSLIARAKLSLGDTDEDEAMTDLGTIYAGIGILLLNTLPSKFPVLGSMGQQNYASEFIDYCSDNQVVETIWQPYVLPQVTAELLTRSPTPSRLLKPFLKARLTRTKNHQIKMLLLVYAVFAVTAGGSVYALTRPKDFTLQQVQQREIIDVLKFQVDQCQEVVRRKQSTWDQTDIFIQRKIEADQTRCQSLENRYNYERSQFNSDL